jgi:hypothetical protein
MDSIGASLSSCRHEGSQRRKGYATIDLEGDALPPTTGGDLIAKQSIADVGHPKDRVAPDYRRPKASLQITFSVRKGGSIVQVRKAGC